MSSPRCTVFEGLTSSGKYGQQRFVEVTCQVDFTEARLVIHSWKSRWSIPTAWRFGGAGNGDTIDDPIKLHEWSQRTNDSQTQTRPVQTRAIVTRLDDLFHIGIHQRTPKSLGNWKPHGLFQYGVARDPIKLPVTTETIEDIHPNKICRPHSLELHWESGRTMVLHFLTVQQREACSMALDGVVHANQLIRGYPEVEYAWLVRPKLVLKDSLFSSTKLLPNFTSGRHYLCLTNSEVLIVRQNLRVPELIILYPHIRRCACRKDGQFRVQVGRASMVGDCELVFPMSDATEAMFVHQSLTRLMEQFSERAQIERNRDPIVQMRNSCPPLPTPLLQNPDANYDQLAPLQSQTMQRIQSHEVKKPFRSESHLNQPLSILSQERPHSRSCPNNAVQYDPGISERSFSLCEEKTSSIVEHSEPLKTMTGIASSIGKYSREMNDPSTNYLEMHLGDSEHYNSNPIPATHHVIGRRSRCESYSETSKSRPLEATQQTILLLQSTTNNSSRRPSSHRDDEELFADIAFQTNPLADDLFDVGINPGAPTRLRNSTGSSAQCSVHATHVVTRPRTCSDVTTLRRPESIQMRLRYPLSRRWTQGARTSLDSQQSDPDNRLTGLGPSSSSMLSDSSLRFSNARNEQPTLRSFSSLKLSTELMRIQESDPQPADVMGSSPPTRPRAYTVGSSQSIGHRLIASWTALRRRAFEKLNMRDKINETRVDGVRFVKHLNQHCDGSQRSVNSPNSALLEASCGDAVQLFDFSDHYLVREYALE